MAVALPGEAPRTGRLTRARVTLSGGLSTAVYVAAYPERTPSCAWRSCASPSGSSHGAPPAGSRTRWWAGSSSAPAACRWVSCARTGSLAGTCRSPARGATCALRSVEGGRVAIGQRDELPAQPRGDLLQAGPLLVRDGAPCFERALDPEGFSAGQAQFDSDITEGRHPRAALGLASGRLLAVACDGRSRATPGSRSRSWRSCSPRSAATPRSTSTAAGRPRSSPVGGCGIDRMRASTCRSRAAGRSRRHCCSCRAERQRRPGREGFGGCAGFMATERTTASEPAPPSRG